MKMQVVTMQGVWESLPPSHPDRFPSVCQILASALVSWCRFCRRPSFYSDVMEYIERVYGDCKRWAHVLPRRMNPEVTIPAHIDHGSSASDADVPRQTGWSIRSHPVPVVVTTGSDVERNAGTAATPTARSSPSGEPKPYPGGCTVALVPATCVGPAPFTAGEKPFAGNQLMPRVIGHGSSKHILNHAM